MSHYRYKFISYLFIITHTPSPPTDVAVLVTFGTPVSGCTSPGSGAPISPSIPAYGSASTSVSTSSGALKEFFATSGR